MFSHILSPIIVVLSRNSRAQFLLCMEPEEERPSFFKVLVGDFSQQLRIPRAFVKNFNSCVPPISGLRGPCGTCWTVNLKEIEKSIMKNAMKLEMLVINPFGKTYMDGVFRDVINRHIYSKLYA
ncbi:B3 domain-containing protein Os03g0622200-like [Rosa rugosa]|uniref:B3 domain-containing protein Os03g0622200-like n=1 Tax=Rosa rugosa TaxID=74645 RepID=UPI002B402094|nr:B3 domain-containing protein Os03g0622200-like [Rosa rugosa]